MQKNGLNFFRGEKMEMEETKKFELNTKKLDNFDKIMSVKLDEIEELKVTSSDNSSKLLNVISLCSNLKTLIIEGDRRINLDKILKLMYNVIEVKKIEKKFN